MSAEDLARAVRDRRAVLGLTPSDIPRRGGPSSMTVAKIEGAAYALDAPVSARSLLKMDSALGWAGGTASRCYHEGLVPGTAPVDDVDARALRIGRLVLELAKEMGQ